MHLICGAVPQALVEARPHKDTRLHLPPREAIVENLIPCWLQAQIIAHNLGQSLQRHIVERGAVPQTAHLATHLSEKRFQQLCYSHAAGDALACNNRPRSLHNYTILPHDTACDDEAMWHCHTPSTTIVGSLFDITSHI